MMNYRAFIASSFFVLAGCKNAPVRHIAQSPTVTVDPSGGVSLSGDAEVPAKVNSSKTGSKMAIPEGSTFAFNDKLGTLTLTVAKATDLALNRTETTVEGPRGFTPDKAPTIKEELDAKAGAQLKVWLAIGMVLGAALAIFGLVRHWNLVMYGGASVSAACAFGLFVQSHPIILLVVAAGTTLAIFGPVIYHTRIKRLESNDAKDG